MAASYSVYHTFPVGTLLIAGTGDHITEIRFCGNVEAAPLQEDINLLPPFFRQCIKEMEEYFEGGRQQFQFPVAQAGTQFQQKVWKELGNIPFGSTISYLELSKRLGDVKAIRAAASANGRNKLAIAVPCHRVIGANQELVGYAGGLPLKKWLLQHESRIAHGVQTLF